MRLLDGPQLPVDCMHLWFWFLELSAARGSNGFGPNPLSFHDIEAWSRLTNTVIRPNELRALIALDHAYLIDYAEASAARRRDGRPDANDHPRGT